MQYRRSFPLACFLLATVALALSGCKLQISVPQGGTVLSNDGAYICETGQICTIDVVDFFFDETFTAVPASGFYFSHWKKQDHGLCGEVTTPCRLYTAAFEGIPALQSLLESEEAFVLEPVFVWNFITTRKLVISPDP